MTAGGPPVAIDLGRRDLVDALGRAVPLRRRSLGLLLCLARHADRLVRKHELVAQNWPGLNVSDDSLARCISDIRAVLGPDLRQTVRTMSGRGYMLEGWQRAPHHEGLLLAPVAPSDLTSFYAPEGAQRPSIAVLPFANIGEDSTDAYFADGIVEDLIGSLSRARWFFVIAKGSAFTYRDRPLDSRQIGRELGVRYILTGTVRRSGERIRLAGKLVEAETGHHLWAGRYDGVIEHIFVLEDNFCADVLAAVEPNVRRAEIERARRKPTADLNAYDLYLRALPLLFAYTSKTFMEAEKLLREAVSRDDQYSDALAALADCVGRMALNGWKAERETSFSEACYLAGRAVAADPENPTSLATAAWAYAMFAGSFDRALDLASRALALQPNSHAVRSYCGWVYAYAGESDQAIVQFQEACRLSPVDPRGYFPLLGLATSNFFARRFDETVRMTDRILLEVPDHNIARRYRAAALAHLGMRAEAQEALHALLARQPNYSLATAKHSRFRHPWMLDLWLTGLESAGLR